MTIELILQPGDVDGIDTYNVSGSYADLNVGSYDILDIGTTHLSKSTAYSRAVVQFDVRSIPAGSTIVDATLRLFYVSGGSLSLPAGFAAYRLTQASWTEFGATWNRYDGTHLWSAAGGDYTTTDHDNATISSPGSDLVFSTLKNLVIDAIDNRGGFLNLLVIGPEAGDTNNFMVVGSSDNANPSVRPKLTINYEPPVRNPIPNFTGGMQQLTGNLGA